MSRTQGNIVLILSAFACFGLSTVVPNSTYGSGPRGPAAAKSRTQEPKEFDRLDGHGATAKKVDVVEWEGNLEIHVYPKGSLKSLGLKIDRESKSSKDPVMVIEYGFQGVPYTLIRRATLGVPMPDAFQTFRDPSAKDYDKVIISGKAIAGLPKFTLASPPAQIYPDFHPELAQDEPGPAAETAKPASGTKGVAPAKAPPSNARRSSESNIAPKNVDPASETPIRNFAF